MIESAPAFANSATWRSGRSIIRWQSSIPPASWTWSRIASTITGADRDRRDEVAVHHVDVDHARAGLHHGADLLAEARVVGRQDRRLDQLLA